MGLWGSIHIQVRKMKQLVESCTIDGNSPVISSYLGNNSNPSSMRHVKPCVNLRGPPRKAKYSWISDSEEYRKGKVKSSPIGR
jgi:hypothetical protein